MRVLNDPVTVNREWNPVLPLVEILRRLDFVWNCKSGNLLNSLMKASEESTSFPLIYLTDEYIELLVPVFKMEAGTFYVIKFFYKLFYPGAIWIYSDIPVRIEGKRNEKKFKAFSCTVPFHGYDHYSGCTYPGGE